MADKHFDLIIVGGGMVGAALAASLSHSGLAIALVEARLPQEFDPEQDYALRVSAISAASRKLLEAADAWSYIESQRHCSYTRMRIWEGDATDDLHFSSADVGLENLGYIIENDLILDALWRQLESVTVLAPAEISALSLTESCARVSLSDGQQLSAQLVIAADGARSRTRALADIHTYGHSYRQQGIVSVVETQAPHENTAWQRFMPTGPLAFLPLENGQCSIVWSAEDELARELLALDDEAFCARLTEASEGRLGQVQAAGPRAAFPLQMQQAEDYIRPRLALVGDAAHVVHPLAGQGVNLGFGDVACLRELLIDAKNTRRDVGGYKLLRRYERARKAEDALTAQMMDGLSRLYGSEHAMLKRGRRDGVRLVNVLKPLKAAFIRHAVG